MSQVPKVLFLSFTIKNFEQNGLFLDETLWMKNYTTEISIEKYVKKMLNHYISFLKCKYCNSNLLKS